MNLHPQLADAADAAARVVFGVTPGQFGDPTPCTDWDVRTLLTWAARDDDRTMLFAGEVKIVVP